MTPQQRYRRNVTRRAKRATRHAARKGWSGDTKQHMHRQGWKSRRAAKEVAA